MSRKVKRWEADVLKRGIGPSRLYVSRVHERMCTQAFDRDDEVFRAVMEAEAAHTHSHSCVAASDGRFADKTMQQSPQRAVKYN